MGDTEWLFILATTLELGIGITDGNILFYCGILELIGYRKFSMREFNYRIVYELFKDPFPVGCGSPDLNLPPVSIDDSSGLNKISRYTPDLLPASIYVAYGKYVSTLDTPSELPQVVILTYDAPNTDHAIIIDKHDCATEKRGYFSRSHDGKYALKNRLFCSACYIHRRVYNCYGSFRRNIDIDT